MTLKRPGNFIFSSTLMAILLTIYFVAMAIATFVENDYGPTASKALFYNAKWFEAIMLLLIINLFGNIVKNRMYRKEKLSIFIFHSAFIVVLLGAFITRYTGEEGSMHIREGSSSNTTLTSETYLNIEASEDGTTELAKIQVLMSPAAFKVKGRLKLNGKVIKYAIEEFIPKARYILEPSEKGNAYIEIITPGSQGRNSVYIAHGKAAMVNGKLLGFNTDKEVDILVSEQDSQLSIHSNTELEVTNKNNWEKITLPAGIDHPFTVKTLYSVNGKILVLKNHIEKGELKLVSDPESDNAPDALVLNISLGDKNEKMVIAGRAGATGNISTVVIDNIILKGRYGSEIRKIPFQLALRDFVMERYPGSNSPSSYESLVTLIDKEMGIERDSKIYMNNILRHRGYRLYQSSYDTDEKGTVLTVNKDLPGTIVTYLGYILLAVGMFLSLFNKNSRFKQLQRNTKTATLILLALLAPNFIHANENQDWKEQLPNNSVSSEHAEEFGKLLVQDNQGRIKPLNTLSSEILRKVSRKTSLEGLTPNQVVLSMLANPGYWQTVPMIRVSHDEIRKLLGIEGKYFAYSDVFNFSPTQNTNDFYKLSKYVNEAHIKKPAYRTKFDNEMLRLDERINICYVLYSHSLLKLFPLPEHPNHKWVSPAEQFSGVERMDSVFIRDFFVMYLSEVNQAVKTDSLAKADEFLEYISIFQQRFGEKIMPPEKKIKIELWYNAANIFDRISNYYGLIGFILLIINFIILLRGRATKNLVNIIGNSLIGIVFIIHAAGLGIRWYISGHAPWSNGYEALIYISWATVLAGLLFARRSIFPVPLTAILAYLILHTAHLSWMDPEITNLVPVLQSVWLVIHVAIITASYGFLALGALIGFNNLLLMNFLTERNKKQISQQIQILSNIAEMTIIAGLYMLTISTFLGGVWANESWGRYWGWDPKETWALISVVIYAIIVHMRLIPGLKGTYAFNLAALFGFSTIIMTFFGVNYYLAGLHSYAKGDPVPIPSFVIYTTITLVVISLTAFFNQQRVKLKSADN